MKNRQIHGWGGEVMQETRARIRPRVGWIGPFIAILDIEQAGTFMRSIDGSNMAIIDEELRWLYLTGMD